MTYRDAVYDVLTDLKKTYDDRDFSINQVLFWVCSVANSMIRSDMERKENGDGIYLSTFNGVSVSLDTVSGNHYVTLPQQVLDLNNNKGIYVSYPFTDDSCDPPSFSIVPFSQTTYEATPRLYASAGRYEYPTAQNPYFYRVGQLLFFLGTKSLSLTGVNLALYTTLNPRNISSLDDTIPFPDEMYYRLKMSVLQLGTFIENIPEESKNDGIDENEKIQAKVPQVEQQ